DAQVNRAAVRRVCPAGLRSKLKKSLSRWESLLSHPFSTLFFVSLPHQQQANQLAKNRLSGWVWEGALAFQSRLPNVSRLSPSVHP
ncbi:MAG: hypothetical protein II343_02400, partial [Clostridia bacterium]|nr:hypothetical protein [Clostridia bacterium]